MSFLIPGSHESYCNNQDNNNRLLLFYNRCHIHPRFLHGACNICHPQGVWLVALSHQNNNAAVQYSYTTNNFCNSCDSYYAVSSFSSSSQITSTFILPLISSHLHVLQTFGKSAPYFPYTLDSKRPISCG